MNFLTRTLFVSCLLLSLFSRSSIAGEDYGILSKHAAAESKAEGKPNILWLSIEDIGPHLGCYGDPNATTPNIDAFASKSLTYDLAWSNYPVCAPARTTIIGGMYACANSAGNMRSETVMPNGVEMFPHFLREAGYYCTNNSKEDYNYLRPANEPWDESSNKAHYRKRKDGQPFFAVFNHTGTHESKIRKRPHTAVIDPDTIKLPSYYPDLPEIRQDWAQYLDNITVMDKWIQRHLDDLQASGQSDNTIVVVFGDHGSGMPRHKRFAGDSGMRVPFIVHVPEKLKPLASPDYMPGGRTKRPIGFIDLAPTVLSVAGIKPPEYMQGHACLGDYQAEPSRYLYGFRERMDERIDLSRSIRDERFIYVRNYLSYLPAGQHVEYQQETQSTAIWNRLFTEGKLNEIQSQFWMPHPPEELYDLVNDPDETKNLAGDTQFQSELARFRLEHRDSIKRFGDLGLIPEPIAYDFANGKKSRRLMLNDEQQFPMDTIFEAANLGIGENENVMERLNQFAEHESASVRYWAGMGILIRGQDGFGRCHDAAMALMNDESDAVAIVGAEIIANHATNEQKDAASLKLAKLADFNESNVFASIAALNALERVGNLTEPVRVLVGKLPTDHPTIKRGNGYIKILKKRLVDIESGN